MPNLWVTPDELDAVGASPFAYEAAKTASFILWALSGRKYSGARTVVEQYECPCTRFSRYPARLWNEPGLFPVEPYLLDGALMNRSTTCACDGTVGGIHTRIRLRHRPARSVQKVLSGGDVVSPASYRLLSGSVLTAAPGHSFDPCGAEVTYTYGVEPPSAGRRAARYLAQELAKGWNGDDCDLPERVTSVSRQGVSYTILDDQAFLNDMRTGIYSVDLFLKAVNPDNARKPARVFSPDLPRANRTIDSSTVPVGPYDFLLQKGTPFTWTVNIDDVNADILLQDDWEPQGVFTNSAGVNVLELDASRFLISGGTISVNLTGPETSTINESGSFDLYAGNTLDGYTIIHLLTSNVRVAA